MRAPLNALSTVLGLGLMMAAAHATVAVGAPSADAPSEANARVARVLPALRFDTVELAGSLDLVLIQGTGTSLELAGNADDLRQVKTDVEGGVLTIKEDDAYPHVMRGPVTAYLTIGALRRIQLAGSGSIQSDAWATPEDLSVDVAGTGTVRLNHLSARKLSVQLSGRGDALVSGRVTEQEIKMAGAAGYHAGDLKSQVTNIAISGRGDATLWVEDALSVAIAGFGNIAYYGVPQISTARAGAGELRALGRKT